MLIPPYYKRLQWPKELLLLLLLPLEALLKPTLQQLESPLLLLLGVQFGS